MNHILKPAVLLSATLILASCGSGVLIPKIPSGVINPPDVQAPKPDPQTQGECLGNLLQNPNAAQFTSGGNTNISPAGPTVVPGWVSAAGTPQRSPAVGYDPAPGWLLGWGYQSGGESFAQTGLNLPAGTYTLKLAVRPFSTTVANYSKYTINFGTSQSAAPWSGTPTIASGSIPVNAPTLPWVPQSHTFTLSAPATVMQVTTVNDTTSAQVDGHPERVSWLGYDGFCLQKVNPVNLHRANSVRVLPNGNTVMVGSADAVSSVPGADPDFATVMYDPAGNILWSRVEHLSSLNDEATDVAVDAQNNVVVVGVKNRSMPVQVHDNSGAVLFRYDVNGTPLGSVTVDNPSTQDWFQGVEIDRDGNIVTGGTDNTQAVSPLGGAGNWRTFKVRRYLPNLTLDTSFNGSGIYDLSINSFFKLTDYTASLLDVAIQEDGKILAAGTSRITELGNENVSAILRLNADGTLDTTYGAGGVQTVGFNPSVVGTGNPAALNGAVSSQFHRILMQGNKAVMVGRVIMGLPNDVCTVTRLDASGKLDPSFGSGGVRLIKQAYCTGIASDGKMLAVTGVNLQASGTNGSDVLDARLIATNGALSSVALGVNNPNSYGAAGPVDVGTNVAYDARSFKYVFSGFTNKSGADDEWFTPLMRR